MCNRSRVAHRRCDPRSRQPRQLFRRAGAAKGIEQIIFLRKIVPGGADKSYGIQVARLAGLSREILDRAKEFSRISRVRTKIRGRKGVEDYPLSPRGSCRSAAATGPSPGIEISGVDRHAEGGR